MTSIEGLSKKRGDGEAGLIFRGGLLVATGLSAHCRKRREKKQAEIGTRMALGGKKKGGGEVM